MAHKPAGLGLATHYSGFSHLVAFGLEDSQGEIDFPTLRQDRTCSSTPRPPVIVRLIVNHIAVWLETHKPAASRRTHLLLASMLWSTVGILLLFFGVRWTSQSNARSVELVIAIAVVVGALKARYILARSARHIIDRILLRDEGHCFGGFLSWRTWGLVAVMSGSGQLLRAVLLPQLLVGTLYTAIGTALVLASWNLWRAWYSANRNT